MEFTDDQVHRMAEVTLHAQHGYAVKFDDLNEEEQSILLDDAKAALEKVFEE